QLTRKIPLPRKGKKYVVRGVGHFAIGVPVLIAVRDMLHLANTTREVKHMIHEKLIKINGKLVRDIKETIKLFNILEVGKSFKLSILPTGRFTFEETKANMALYKVTNRKMVKDKKIQLNLHDGTNILLPEKEKISVGDSLELDFQRKLKK